MIRQIQFLFLFSIFFGSLSLSSQNMYDETLPQQCNLNDPATNEILTFPYTFGNAIGNATLTIVSIGDIASSLPTSTEHLDYYDENNTLIGQTGGVGNCNLDTFTYTMPLADVLAFSADGQIEITVIPRSGVNDLQCSSQIGSASYCSTGRLQYPAAPPPPDNAGVMAILEPIPGCAGQKDVIARIGNFGSNRITSVQVRWMFNGVSQTPVNYTNLLDTIGGNQPNSADVLLGTVTLTAGTPDSILVYTTLPNNQVDPFTLNDSMKVVYNSIPTVSMFPYIQDFESGPADWVIEGANSTWAFGTPAKANIMGASSGDSAFVNGGLTGNYNNSENSWVNSPCFDISGFAGTPWVALDVNWDTENSWDGANLNVSYDGGNTWMLVGNDNDPYNWYNDNSINGNPGGSQEGWTGSGTNGSGGWVTAKHQLDENQISENVRFRVNFGSDGSVNFYDGFAFDNFMVADFKEANLGNDVLSKCGGSNVTLNPNVNFNGSIEWSTGDTISPSITVTDTGIYWVIYTDTLLDLSTGDTIRVIESDPPVIDFAKTIDTIGINGQITLDPRTSFGLSYDWQPIGWPYPYLLLYGSDLGLGPHNYTLTVTDSLGCSDQEQVTVVVVDFTGINEYSKATVKYYPNPAHDVLNIQLEGFENKPTKLNLLDLYGRIVQSQVVQKVNGEVITLNVSTLAKGTYLLNIRNDSQTAVTKVIVE